LCVRELLGAIYRGALKVPGRSPPARGGSSFHERVKISGGRSSAGVAGVLTTIQRSLRCTGATKNQSVRQNILDAALRNDDFLVEMELECRGGNQGSWRRGLFCAG
jgi:hypothetical protein